MAANFTVTAPRYVPPAPGVAGSSVAVVTGARSSLSVTIVNVTVLAVSTLPAASVER